MSSNKEKKIGEIHPFAGCFTEEYCIRGLNLYQIANELGLPQRIIDKGVFIAFALRLPSFHGFELGGWAKYPTDKFASHPKDEMGQKRTIWSEVDFEKTYDGKRMPISIEEAKLAWLKNMQHEKLVKVLPVDEYQNDIFPVGGLASQIIVRFPNTIPCLIVKELKEPGDVFSGVWN